MVVIVATRQGERERDGDGDRGGFGQTRGRGERMQPRGGAGSKLSNELLRLPEREANGNAQE